MPAVNEIKLRRGTGEQWSGTNPVLSEGEPGFDTTNKVLKVGDGVSPWSLLDKVNTNSSFRNYELVNSTKSTFNVDTGYSINNIDVYHNGIKLVNSQDFTATNGTSFVLASPAVSGDVVEWTGFANVPKINLSLGEVRSDYVENTNYIGIATAGSSENNSVWRIKKNIISSDGTTIITTTATNVKWTDRLTASYI